MICAFASIDAAIKAHDSQGYKKALDALAMRLFVMSELLSGVE